MITTFGALAQLGRQLNLFNTGPGTKVVTNQTRPYITEILFGAGIKTSPTSQELTGPNQNATINQF